mmetsp:Transcript_14652/g.31265  ORF Transcript_14652/g.31265 Transcript_14652/m.31265 type:complete len:270 (+) Transcript_14652:325-1134(+)
MTQQKDGSKFLLVIHNFRHCILSNMCQKIIPLHLNTNTITAPHLPPPREQYKTSKNSQIDQHQKSHGGHAQRLFHLIERGVHRLGHRLHLIRHLQISFQFLIVHFGEGIYRLFHLLSFCSIARGGCTAIFVVVPFPTSSDSHCGRHHLFHHFRILFHCFHHGIQLFRVGEDLFHHFGRIGGKACRHAISSGGAIGDTSAHGTSTTSATATNHILHTLILLLRHILHRIRSHLDHTRIFRHLFQLRNGHLDLGIGHASHRRIGFAECFEG